MFAMIKWIAGSLVKLMKLAVGLLLGAVLFCTVGQLFAVGSVAGMVVTASCWITERAIPAILGGLSAAIQSAGLLWAAIGIMAGLLLLGVAKLAAEAGEALIEPVVAGYERTRPARSPAAASA